MLVLQDFTPYIWNKFLGKEDINFLMDNKIILIWSSNYFLSTMCQMHF